jgi:hypothetical protein
MEKFYKTFAFIVLSSLIGLFYITYENEKFFNNPLDKEVLLKVDKKIFFLKQRVYQLYGVKVSFPVEIVQKIPDNLYGLATYSKDGKIRVLLNKNRFKENENYMIDYVLPHEYAHAMMFYFGNFTKQNGGHTKKWQQICLSLGGKKCDRYVGQNDILLEKVSF